MSTKEDFEILEGIAAGDTLVIKDFYKKNYNYIRSYVLQNSGNETDVEDVFQDGLIVIYQKLTSDSLDIQVSVRTYFYAICKNIWRNRLRKNGKEMINTDLVHATLEAEEFIIEDNDNEYEIVYRKYFLTLSSACKEILNLFFAGNSMREIANNIGYSEGYARKKKFECKKTLIEMIEKDLIYQELTSISEKK